MLPIYMIAILIFAVLIIVTLLSIIGYMLLFKKSTVVVFGNNGIPNCIKKGKKKGTRIVFKGGANFPITNNYVQEGKKKIYFCQQDDDRTFKPYIPPALKEKVDYNLNNAVADSFEEGAKKFKFGFEKFAPFITITVVCVMCIIGTIMTVKYNTDIQPTELDAIIGAAEALDKASQNYAEGAKANQVIVEKLGNQNNEGEPPK